MSDKPLTPEMRLAAAKLAGGEQVKQVAESIGVDRSTLSRWRLNPAFRDLTRKHREQLMPESPTAEATLLAGLSACTPKGDPDWPSRIASAKAILSSPVTDASREQASRIERVYLAAPEGNGSRRDDSE